MDIWNDTCDLINLPKGKRGLQAEKEGAKIVKYKAPSSEGILTKKRINFDEIFSQMVKMISICIALG